MSLLTLSFIFFRFLLFQFILPSIQIILFCVCIGNAPYGLKMAIVNNETQGLGELFIRELDNNTIEKVIHKNGIALETMTPTLFLAKCSKWTVWIIALNFFLKKNYGWGGVKKHVNVLHVSAQFFVLCNIMLTINTL